MTTPATYAAFQELQTSEKVGLVMLNAGVRLVGWELYSGSVYRVAADYQKLLAVNDSGNDYTEVTSIGAVTASKYYHDRSNGYIYLRATDSSNPNSRFLAATIRWFFSNVPVRAPHDLDSGYEVEWLPMVKSTSAFETSVDNNNLLGFAIEGSGAVTFHNDQEFWASKYDKFIFENQQCLVYSWNRLLPITEADLIYKGQVDSKSYRKKDVAFSLKDQISNLRNKLTIGVLSDVAGARIPADLNNARQRILFGYVKGNRPTNIDQMLPTTGYPLTGTVAVTISSATVTGTSTIFLSELSPGDELQIGDGETKYTIKSVDTNTQVTLTEAYEGSSATGLDIALTQTDRGKRYMNRLFLVAGHELRQPETTISRIYSLTTFEVADPTDFIAGEPVTINGENLVIERVSGSRITLTQSAANMVIGDTVTIQSVRNVYLNNRLLTNDVDYVYDAEDATIELDPLAEFNVAPVRSLTGTLAFTNAGTDLQKRTVTGTGTFFKKELQPGDWVRRANESDWFEVLSVNSDTEIYLRTACTYSSTGAALNKNPDVYVEGESVLSCDVLGVTEDGTKEGVFMNNAPRIVKYLISEVGLEDLIDEDSFDEVDSVTTPFLGFSVPARYPDTDIPIVRDIINKINQSVFGTLYQTPDFQLAYSVLSPSRPESMKVFEKSDLISDWTVSSNAQNLIKKVLIEYLIKEYDVAAGAESKSVTTRDSERISYFTDITRERTFSTYLIDAEDANRYARRWSFILETSNSTLSMKLGMGASRVRIHEVIHVKEPKLFERIGSGLAQRIGGVSRVQRGLGTTSLEVDDVSGSFSRCAAIAPSDAADFSDATDSDKFVNGYITDAYGMIDNDAETFGINLIW